MKKENRAIVVVLDSLGVGELPDAAQFGDAGCHTLLHILARMPDLALPNLRSLGLLRLLGAQDAGRITEALTEAMQLGQGREVEVQADPKNGEAAQGR